MNHLTVSALGCGVIADDLACLQSMATASVMFCGAHTLQGRGQRFGEILRQAMGGPGLRNRRRSVQVIALMIGITVNIPTIQTSHDAAQH